MIRYVFGARPRPDGSLRVDPLPCGLASARLERLSYRGHALSIALLGEAVHVRVDGLAVEGRMGEPLELRW